MLKVCQNFYFRRKFG